MSLFSKDRTILAAQTGKAIDLEDVNDPVFSEKILGDGIAVIPSGPEVLSPVSGTITQIAHTYHAVGIKGDDDVDVLLHMGIDTVKLEGEGFSACIEEGQHVDAGQKIMDMDLDFIRSQGYDPITPCIITNMDDVKKISKQKGETTAGVTEIITYKK